MSQIIVKKKEKKTAGDRQTVDGFNATMDVEEEDECSDSDNVTSTLSPSHDSSPCPQAIQAATQSPALPINDQQSSSRSAKNHYKRKQARQKAAADKQAAERLNATMDVEKKGECSDNTSNTTSPGRHSLPRPQESQSAAQSQAPSTDDLETSSRPPKMRKRKQSRQDSDSKKSKKQLMPDRNNFMPPCSEDEAIVFALEQSVVLLNPSTPWDDIGGQSRAKKSLQETVILPMIIPEYFVGIRRPKKGVLMIGPPGDDSMLLAKALAAECKATFFSLSSSRLLAAGEFEKVIPLVFSMARHYGPSVIFFENIDAICPSQGTDYDCKTTRRLKCEILKQIEQLTVDASTTAQPTMSVTIFAASSIPWNVDEALIRLLETRINVELPNQEGRKKFLERYLKDGVHVDTEVDLDSIATELEGYSGEEITAVCHETAMMPIRRAIRDMNWDEIRNLSPEILEAPITMSDFTAAMESITKTVSESELKKLSEWIEACPRPYVDISHRGSV